ncbi:peptidyl-prolyl cis-trans isomerase [Bacillaceae bacterium S4-13-56]
MNQRVLLVIIALLLITNIGTLLTREQGTNPNNTTVDDNGTIQPENGVVGRVGDKDITEQEWMSALQKEYGEEILHKLIDHKVVFQLAEETGITINDKLIQRDLLAAESVQGILTDEERNQRQEQWKKDILFRYYLEELLTRDVEVPEEEIREFYNKDPQYFNFDESYQLSQIVVDSQQEGNQVWEELENGASFAMLAREYSEDPYTANNGGYLGFYTDESQYFSPSFYEEAAKLKEGEYTKPFRTNEGITILYLHRKLPAVTFSYEEVKDQIRREIAMDLTRLPLDAEPLWEEADATIVGDK